MKFVNREYELGALEKWWKTKKAQLVILYGKRRVGKTSLALWFGKNREMIYYLADRLPCHIQLNNFAKKLSTYFNEPLLKHVTDWETLFKYLGEQKKQILIIIDEFPYLIESDPAISSLFQKGWDLYLKNSKSFLILTGSSMSMMLKHTLLYKAPLYGRRTGNILLKPFTIQNLSKFFPKSSFKERLLIYSFVGGTPAYLDFFKKSNDPYELLQETVFSKDHFLFQEVEFLLREELREPSNYFAILAAIANKNTKLSEIIAITGLEKSFVSSYLRTLQDLGLVKREVPITEKYPERSKKGHYSIDDPFISFWFDYVFPNKDHLERSEPSLIIKKLKDKEPERISKVYELVSYNIFIEALLKINSNISFQAIGRWWNKDTEIDFVALNERENYICFGEVKWTNRFIHWNLLNDLKNKSVNVDWGNRNTKKYYAFFTKSGYTKEFIKKAKKEGDIFLFHYDKLILKP